MNKKAFPVHPLAHDRSNAECEALSGMSLRDYFAAKAMQGYVTRGGGDEGNFDIRVSRWAYELADAMLKARES